jgi:hypothetical protein
MGDEQRGTHFSLIWLHRMNETPFYRRPESQQSPLSYTWLTQTIHSQLGLLRRCGLMYKHFTSLEDREKITFSSSYLTFSDKRLLHISTKDTGKYAADYLCDCQPVCRELERLTFKLQGFCNKTL